MVTTLNPALVGSALKRARTVAACSPVSLSGMETLGPPPAVENGVTGYFRMFTLERSSNDRSATVSSTTNLAIITRWSVQGRAGQASGLGNEGTRSTRPPPVGTRIFKWEDTTGTAWAAPGHPRTAPIKSAARRRTARLPCDGDPARGT